ncbi:hypothetical protein D9757_009333 [Collybiopsis confluens]|uniref:Uncharacterized protein n=1 Tax=Collybiopsis confluens TaxID=2823264 RepID=A0A8H5M0I7_9AGAR|nr:hypothetical protein D9757_009333 [Collybiopsis confluens]
MCTLPNGLSIISSYLSLVLWLTPFVYFFNLSNQIVGVEEDRINKPDRPLPSGKVTLAGAKRRWALTLAVFISVALFNPSLLVETIVWVLVTALLTVTPYGNHWFVKSCLGMGIGTWALLRGSWKSIAPLTPQAERHALAMSAWTGLLTQIQDIRDIKGDAIIGRYTLPIAVGDSNAGGILALSPALLVGAHIFIGYRILQKQNGPRYDHKTYMIYTYVFCLILSLTALKELGWNTNFASVVDHIRGLTHF